MRVPPRRDVPGTGSRVRTMTTLPEGATVFVALSGKGY